MVSRPELGSDPPFGLGRESGRDKLVSEPRFRRFWKVFKISDAPIECVGLMQMSLLCLLSRMDPPQEAVDETAESVNPLDPSASGPSESTMNENASTEALVKVFQNLARVLDRLTAPTSSE